jgi:hypothetical protein
MNWYFEDNGVAQGPHLESELEAQVRVQKLSADSLIWHAGLAEWQPVQKLRPLWLVALKPAIAAESIKELTESAPPAPAQEEAKPTLRPTAPLKSKESPEAAEENKPGILKRIFGLGKKGS